MVWPGYYRNAGAAQMVSANPQGSFFRIRDFTEMDPAHCRLMEGWITTAMGIMGGKVTSGAAEVKCMSKGDDCHEFVWTWTV